MHRFQRILCVVQPGGGAAELVRLAALQAEAHQAQLKVVSVLDDLAAVIGLPPGGPTGTDLQGALRQARGEWLDGLVAGLEQRGPVTTALLSGTFFLEVIREVLRHGHDLVIKAPEQEDWLQRMLGSEDMHLLRKCPCPVWLAGPRHLRPYRHIFAAVDVGDDCSSSVLQVRHELNLAVLEMAASLALADLAELHVVHAWDAPGEGAMRGPFANMPESRVVAYVAEVRRRRERGLDALMGDLAGRVGPEAMALLAPRRHMPKGWARREIPALLRQHDADLVVMGTVARTGIPGFFMGNTAEAILGQIDCSVLAVKPAGFCTPVTIEG